MQPQKFSLVMYKGIKLQFPYNVMFVLLICELYIDVYYQGDVKRLHQQSENQFDRSKLYVDFI